MRVLVAPFGSRGDVQPMLALAAALQARGHQVTVCAPPDYAEWISRLGLTGHPIGISMHEFVRRSAEGLRGIRYAMGAFPKLIGDQYAVLEPFANNCDVMLGSTLTSAGASFAEKLSIPYHYVSFTPCAIPSAEHPSLFTKSQGLPRWLNRLTWWFSAIANNLGLRSTINAQRRRLGLAPINDAWMHLLNQRLIVASEPALAPLPRDAPDRAVQTGAWLLPETEELPADLEEFLQAGSAPVYIGFGSMPDVNPARTTRRVLEGVKRAGVRALISRGAGLAQGDLPAGVFAVGSTPHGKLFPRCAAIVHHGGAGTTTTAARAGVPQVLVPHMTDQFYWRHRLQELRLTPGPVRLADPESLSAALRTCVDDAALRERARAFASTLSVDGLARAVQLVEQSGGLEAMRKA